jgi:hypothetical protein
MSQESNPESTITKREMVDMIYMVLHKKEFSDWFNIGRFDDHITGMEDAPNFTAIKDDIERMFSLKS